MISSLAQAIANGSPIAAPAVAPASTPAPDGAVPFGNFLRGMMQETAKLETKASDAVTGVMDGRGVDLHDAMIAVQKADMSFELALQVRNKAVTAYQQMMNMQF